MKGVIFDLRAYSSFFCLSVGSHCARTDAASTALKFTAHLESHVTLSKTCIGIFLELGSKVGGSEHHPGFITRGNWRGKHNSLSRIHTNPTKWVWDDKKIKMHNLWDDKNASGMIKKNGLG